MKAMVLIIDSQAAKCDHRVLLGGFLLESPIKIKSRYLIF